MTELRWVAMIVASGWAASAAAQVRLSGQLVSQTKVPIAGARVSAADESGYRVLDYSNAQGRFVLTLPKVGRYNVEGEHQGYFPARSGFIEITGQGDEVVLAMQRQIEGSESVEVNSSSPSIDMDTTNSGRTLLGSEIQNIPYPNTNDFRMALRMVPGVLRDNRGGLHVNGSAEDQVLYTLGGFNLNDPLTGRFETRLSVESVQSVEIASGHLPAEFGKGSAGTLAVHAKSGDGKLRYSATNFVPGFENRKGWTIGDWVPRAGISGPIRKGRAWFSDTADIQYSKVFIRELPKGADRYAGLRLGNMLNAQWNLTPSQIIQTGFLFNSWSSGRTGLTALDPVETTVDRRSRQWFYHVKDQFYLKKRFLIEAGFAANRTFGREIPQGYGTLGITPNGKRGNHFIDGIRKAGRDQILVNAFLPSLSFAGTHQVKAGIDLDHVTYWQNVRRTGFENFSEAGWRTLLTTFQGSGQLSRTNEEASLYVQDSWRIVPALLLEVGVRGDWDRILRVWSASPRLGAAWSPGRKGNTKLYAGFARVFDATNLRIFTRPLDQYSLASYYDPAGALVRGPALTIFTIRNPHLSRPRFQNLSLGLEQHLPAGFSFRADLLRRRGSKGFTYLNRNGNGNEPAPEWAGEYHDHPVDSLFDLSNLRMDRYDSASVTLRQNIRRLYSWMVSYTRSRSLSNTVSDVSVEDPISVSDNAGPMPWDAPNRFLGWGYLPLPRKNWGIAFAVDGRTGYPFSVKSEEGRVMGAVNSYRFPAFFELNVHLERRFILRHHRWALRFGANNITDRINPDTVNNVLSSAKGLRFYGGTGRATNFRIRWLGRE